MKTYDAAFVPCREPNPITWDFSEDHKQVLERVLELQRTGVFRLIVLSGGHATWYDNEGIVPPFGTECDASGNRLIELGCPPEVLLKDPRAQDSIANFVCSGEDIFGRTDIENVLVVAAEERLPRLRVLGRRLLAGVVEMDFESIGSANDPWLAQKEPFTLAITERYLKDVPSGRAGWPIVKSWFYTEGIYRFWMSFDAAHQRAKLSAPENTIWNISDIVADMDPRGLPPDILEFAAAIARDPVLA